MRKPSAVIEARLRWALAVIPTFLVLALPATSAGYVNQEEMRTSPAGRYTFVYDPGIGHTIPRQAFAEPLLASYYKARGFDANFVDWAPINTFEPGSAEWASCVNKPHPEPCPVGFFHFDPVRVGIKFGPITAVYWNGAFIGTYCGNFTPVGGKGPTPEITGVKYEDRNADGVREAGEPGLSGWTINLLYEGKVVASTTTDGEGRYSFKLDADRLPIGPGVYQVQEVQKAGWVQSAAPGAIRIEAGVGARQYGGNDFGNYDPKITAKGQSLSGTEGAEVSGAVATFTDPDVSAAPSEYSARIEWGDGSESTGAVSEAGGEFSVDGSHTYAEEGSYTVTVTINDVDNASNTATTTSTATIADAPLTSACAAPATALQAFAGATAKFTDADPGGTSADYVARIEWGDGSESGGTVSAGAGHGPYVVSGSHLYEATGPFTITTTIADVGGSRTVAKCETLVFAFPSGGGAFVIGNGNAAVGTEVTFWGRQWWKENSLTGGSRVEEKGRAPASFKGFADEPATPGCGIGWSTRPGNSSKPPAAPLPAYMGVIVSSMVHQSGSTISGDTVHIVVVKTNPGYEPDPGHASTGIVEAMVC